MEIGLENGKMTNKNESCEFSAKLTNLKPIGHIHLITSFSM